MKLFTTHLRPDQAPVLVREGFSWGAFLFGFLYFAVCGAWIAAVLDLAAVLLAYALGRATGSAAPLIGLFALQGIFGRDLLRWGLARRGFAEGPVVAAADHDQAFARLLGARADLIPAGPEF
jgi:hypothetical protein